MAQHHHKEYRAEDFERYYSGQMPGAEMHALEKAALEDPFLADALEGYQYSQTPVKDIAVLKERLQKDKKKNILFFLQNKTWLKVAASVILITGIGYFIYEGTSTKKNPAETSGLGQIIKATPDSTLVAKSDTSKKEQRREYLNVTDSNYRNKSDLAINDKPLKEAYKGSLPTDAKAGAGFYAKENKSTNGSNFMQGQVMSGRGKPETASTIAGLKKNVSATNDSFDKFKLAQSDSMLTTTVAPTGDKIKDFAKNEKQLIVSEPEKKDLMEVVIMGAGKKRSEKNIGYSTTTIAGGTLGADSLYGPEGGWQKFNQYISDNIHSQANEAGENYKGKVVLSFEVNKNGNPKKIKTTQTLCGECDKEARRLLLHGPKWKYSNGKRYEVSIVF